MAPLLGDEGSGCDQAKVGEEKGGARAANSRPHPPKPPTPTTLTSSGWDGEGGLQ